MPRDHRHDGFLKAILEDVENDAPRLIYADWLEERGDPRSEFIRLQCRLDKIFPDDPVLPELLQREQELADRHREEWLEDWPDLEKRDVISCGFQGEPSGCDHLFRSGFHRGFPVVTLDLSNSCASEACDRFALRASWFNWWVSKFNPASLCIKAHVLRHDPGGRDARDVIRWAEGPDFVYVIGVDLHESDVDDVSPLVSPSALKTNYRYLDLGRVINPDYSGLSSESLAALVNSPHTVYLRYLNLDGQGWDFEDSRGLRSLLNSPHLNRLVKLVVDPECFCSVNDQVACEWNEDIANRLKARFGTRLTLRHH